MRYPSGFLPQHLAFSSLRGGPRRLLNGNETDELWWVGGRVGEWCWSREGLKREASRRQQREAARAGGSSGGAPIGC